MPTTQQQLTQFNTEQKDEKRDRARQLFRLVAPLKITKLEADFSGSGDSGEVHSVRLLGSKGKSYSRYSDSSESKIPQEVWQLANSVANDLTDVLTGDWWNNDGGYGTIKLDFATKIAVVEANYQETRVVETEEKNIHLPCYSQVAEE